MWISPECRCITEILFQTPNTYRITFLWKNLIFASLRFFKISNLFLLILYFNIMLWRNIHTFFLGISILNLFFIGSIVYEAFKFGSVAYFCGLPYTLLSAILNSKYWCSLNYWLSDKNVSIKSSKKIIIFHDIMVSTEDTTRENKKFGKPLK